MADAARNSDAAFGSLVSWMVRQCYRPVETLNRDSPHRYYFECLYCMGTNESREHYKSTIEAVKHEPDCLLAVCADRLDVLQRHATTDADAENKNG